MKKTSARVSGAVVLIALLGGLGYIGVHIAQDMGNVAITSAWPYVLLGVALLIALGFEFVNGFHDTANAVATVIYTHSLDPNIAVVWSGLCNLVGVLMSTGAVAFSVITLLPVELILKVSAGAGFAMVFALLIAAIIWNLSTWWFGLPASSSHTMVGSIIGVGIANQIMSASSGTSGVDWGQVGNVFRVLLISPVVGFCCAAILLLVLKPASRLIGSLGLAVVLALSAYFLFKWSPLWTAVFAIGVTVALAIGLSLIPTPEALFRAPEGTAPPPWPIRALLILTCSGVSYFHGSNDGQKGHGPHHAHPHRHRAHGVCAESCRTRKRRAGFCDRVATSRPGDRQACGCERHSRLRRTRRGHAFHRYQATSARHHDRDARTGERFEQRDRALQGIQGGSGQPAD